MRMSEFEPIIQVGFERGQADFRVTPTNLSFSKIDELIVKTYWALRCLTDFKAHSLNLQSGQMTHPTNTGD